MGDGGRGRSSSPSRGRGRSRSPSRGDMRGRSTSRDAMNRGRSTSRDAYTRSASRDRMTSGRGRSRSQDRMDRSGRSTSRDRLPVGSSRGRSSSPSNRRGNGSGSGGRSVSGDRIPRSSSRSRSRSPTQQRRGNSSRDGDFDDEPSSSRRPRRGKRRSIAKSAKRIAKPAAHLGQSMRRLAPAGESCTTARFCSYVIPITLIIACSIGLVIATGNANKITPPVLQRIVPTLDVNDLSDPFSGNPDNVPQWNNGGTGGLELELLNALDPEWHVVFDLAVADWDFGSPDAVSVSKQVVAPEKDCSIEAGKVKVCNGDYGDTNWRGINSAMVDSSNFITASAAKMNEFYLKFDIEGTRQYTMCHEIGHSMGLPHTDENFDNEDLGNCMDYTNNFDDNKHPDEGNYERLTEFYGEVGSRRRNLRRRRQITDIPEHVLSTFHEVVSELEKRPDDDAHERGWRLLHRTKHGEAHELSLPDGYTARVDMLLYNSRA